jgi:hypothetical protein
MREAGARSDDGEFVSIVSLGRRKKPLSYLHFFDKFYWVQMRQKF